MEHVFGILIPLIAVIFAFSTLIVKRILSHIQEMARIKGASGTTLNQSQSGEIEALRQEIMKLRDTTTQYDMSVERTLTEVKSRLTMLEENRLTDSRVTPRVQAAPPSNEEVQQVRLGG